MFGITKTVSGTSATAPSEALLTIDGQNITFGEYGEVLYDNTIDKNNEVATKIYVDNTIGGAGFTVEGVSNVGGDIDLKSTSGAVTIVGSDLNNDIDFNVNFENVSEGATKKILTVSERSNISSNTSHVSNSSGVHGVVGNVVGTTDTQTLTNKTIDADLNTITNISNTSVKVGAAIDADKIEDATSSHKFVTASQITDIGNNTTHVGNSSGVHGISGSIVGTSDTQTLTNKTIDADLNTITNISNTSVKVGAGIDADKIEDATSAHKFVTASQITDIGNNTTHVSNSSGVHGISGSVVGTTDTQTLTNKTFGDNLNMNNFKITNLGTPVATGDATNKQYVDSLSAGLDYKESCRLATTVTDGNIDLATGGLLTIDSVTTNLNDRVLVKNQTDAKENGIYKASSGAWVRTADMDGSPAAEISGGNTTFVEDGTANAGQGYVLVFDGIINLGVDDINFTQISTATSYTAGTGLNLVANEFSIDSTVATLTGAQTLTNKTINGANNSLTLTATNISNVIGSKDTQNGYVGLSSTRVATISSSNSGSIPLQLIGTSIQASNLFECNKLGVRFSVDPNGTASTDRGFKFLSSTASGNRTANMLYRDDTTNKLGYRDNVSADNLVILDNAVQTMTNKTVKPPNTNSDGLLIRGNSGQTTTNKLLDVANNAGTGYHHVLDSGDVVTAFSGNYGTFELDNNGVSTTLGETSVTFKRGGVGKGKISSVNQNSLHYTEAQKNDIVIRNDTANRNVLIGNTVLGLMVGNPTTKFYSACDMNGFDITEAKNITLTAPSSSPTLTLNSQSTLYPGRISFKASGAEKSIIGSEGTGVGAIFNATAIDDLSIRAITGKKINLGVGTGDPDMIINDQYVQINGELTTNGYELYGVKAFSYAGAFPVVVVGTISSLAHDENSIVRLGGTPGNFEVQNISIPARDWRELTVLNVTGANCKFKSTGNIQAGGDYTIVSGTAAKFIYDGTSNLWRAIKS